MDGVRRALLLATAERYAVLVANFTTLAIVSRLLSPAEIGVSVVGFSALALIVSAREFGTTNFIIQHKELSPQHSRAAFTVLFLLSLAISSVILGSAGGLARIYSEPNLEPFLYVISISILVEPIAAIIAALLRREMAFGRLAIINVTGAAVNAGVTISLAALGFSYMSFAWGFLASIFAIACVSLAFWPEWSIFKPSLREWRGVATFGWYHGLNVYLYRAFEAMPYIVLGRILSFEAVALYNRAFTICELPSRVLLRGLDVFLLPLFSKHVRNGKGLRDMYLHSLELITAVQWPVLVLIAILADPLVRLLLGEQWLGSVPLVRIMAVASLVTSSAYLNYPVLVSLGAMRDVLMRSLITWPTSAVIIAGAAFFGLKAAVFSWLVVMPFQAFVSIYFVQRHVDIRWRDFVNPIKKATGVALCSGVGPLFVVFCSGGRFDLSYMATAVAVILSTIGWGVGLWLTAHPFLTEMEKIALMFIKSPFVRNNAALLPLRYFAPRSDTNFKA